MLNETPLPGSVDKPITEVGALEDAARISNQEKCRFLLLISVKALSCQHIEDRPPTESEDFPAGMRRSSRTALRTLPLVSTTATFAEPHDPQENASGNAGGDNRKRVHSI